MNQTKKINIVGQDFEINPNKGVINGHVTVEESYKILEKAGKVMNQTKPKTVEDVLNKFDIDFRSLSRNLVYGEKIKDFIRSEITTLLESFNTEVWDAPGSFAAGYNARNRELEKEINKILGI